VSAGFGDDEETCGKFTENSDKSLLQRSSEPDNFRGLTSHSMNHSVGTGGFPVSQGGRWLLLAWSLFLLGGFALARSVEPDPRGFGTHQRLGLPPCTFRALCNLPCPSCGMTTSFAHLTRGHLALAIQSNAGGALLALVCAAQIPWCWWSACRGRLVGVSQPARGILAVMLTVAGVSVLNWLFQLIGG
jgi:hypothetical protein